MPPCVNVKYNFISIKTVLIKLYLIGDWQLQLSAKNQCNKITDITYIFIQDIPSTTSSTVNIKNSRSSEFYFNLDIQNSRCSEFYSNINIQNSRSSEFYSNLNIENSRSPEFYSNLNIQNSCTPQVLNDIRTANVHNRPS